MAKSTYYYKSRLKADDEKAKLIEPVIKEFTGYGYRRVTKHLRRESKIINHKVVLRIMKSNGWLCKRKRQFKPTTNSKHNCPVYPNLIKGLEITGINQVWVADITYIALIKEFAYLAAILDAYSRRVIGYNFSHMLTKTISLNALQMALNARKPHQCCIHHSDRGVQYACNDYVAMLAGNGFKISMSEKGNPYQNAKAESWFKTLKCEEVYLNEYETFGEARRNIEKFILEVYNRKRLHSALGYVSPEEFEENLMRQQSKKMQQM
jgi:putative transposase